MKALLAANRGLALVPFLILTGFLLVPAGVSWAKVAKISICHKPGAANQKVVMVGPDDVAKHLAHGDFIIGEPCSEGVGQCQMAGLTQCDPSGDFCSATPGTPTAEICDGLDNNCDGSADNASQAQLNASCDDGKGYTADVCESGGTCSNNQTGNIVFVTSTTIAGGSIGGLAGGDAICDARAADAGLPGSYTAWLSTGSTLYPAVPIVNARDRVSDATYVRVDGEKVADDTDDLTDGTLDAPINVTEAGNTLITSVWTGTQPDGTPAFGSGVDLNCVGWTQPLGGGGGGGVVGSTNYSIFRWTEVTVFPADCGFSSFHLYCFQNSSP